VKSKKFSSNKVEHNALIPIFMEDNNPINIQTNLISIIY